MKFLLTALSMALIISCSHQNTAKAPALVETSAPEAHNSDLSPSKLELGKQLSLWSTYYYAPLYSSDGGGYDVRDINGKSLGVKLNKKDLCNLMLEGGGYIDGKVYAWAGTSSRGAISCSKYFSRSMVNGKGKFKLDVAIRGVRNYKITPFKTIAVDRHTIPYGSRIFIPAMKGIKYVFEGKEYVHDGIVTAQDTGGAIKGSHIDFYIGPVMGGFRNTLPVIKPFSGIVKSTSSGKFKAYLIK